MVKKSSPKSQSRYHVPNLDRALDILELLPSHPEGLGMSELAAKLELPRNSVFRIASTLLDRGYLQRDEASKRFSLGHQLLRLGYASVNEGNLVEKSMDVLRSLRDATKETALLGVLVGCEGAVLEQAAGLYPVKFLIDAGTRFPLHSSAAGKAILAFLPEAERERILSQLKLERFNERTITAMAGFRRELAVVMSSGYAVDNAEQIEGLRCVGAPIFDQTGRPVAGIWVTAPAYRLPENSIPQVAKLVMAHAAMISRRFGHAQE